LRIGVFESAYLTPRPNSPSYMVLLKNQVEWFAKLGNEVTVLAEGKTSVENGGLYTISSLTGVITPFSRTFLDRKEISYFSGVFSPEIISKAARILRKLNLDVIYTCGTSFSAVFAALLGRLTGIPTVHYVFEYTEPWMWWKGDSETLKGYKIPLTYKINQFINTLPRELFRREILQKWGLKNVTKIIASSNYVKRLIQKFIPVGNNIYVVYPHVDLPTLTWEARNHECLITYLGHLWQGRGVLDLVLAFSKIIDRYPQAKLVIASTNIHGLTEHYLNKLIRKFKLESRLIRIGKVNDVYHELMLPSTVIALPYRDTPSIKLIEAMAAGKPVVTTRIKWTSELISDGENGFLAGVGDIEEIANKLEIILENPKTADEVGKKARETIKKMCASEKNVRRILDIIKREVTLPT